MKKCEDCFIGLQFIPYENAYLIFEHDIIQFTNVFKDEYFDRLTYCAYCGNKIDWKSIDEYIKKYG